MQCGLFKSCSTQNWLFEQEATFHLPFFLIRQYFSLDLLHHPKGCFLIRIDISGSNCCKCAILNLYIFGGQNYVSESNWTCNILPTISIKRPVFTLFIFQVVKTVVFNWNPQFTPPVALKMCSFDSLYVASGESVLFSKTRHRLPFEWKSTFESNSTFYVPFESNVQFRLYILPHPKLCFPGKTYL